jgi:hypothetical protein
MVTLTNPRLLARQAETVRGLDEAIKTMEAARQDDLAEVVNEASGEPVSVADAIAMLDKAD